MSEPTLAPPDGPLRVISLKANNFKRIKAVSIDPDPTVVEISGRNGQGKTSVIDALFTTIAGGAALPDKPIREGQTRANVRLDLGKYIVERSYKEGSSPKLTITAKDGEKVGSPQGLLNQIAGDLTLDPFEFQRMKPREQRDKLIQLCPLTVNLDELAEQKQRLYDDRTIVNRELKTAEASLQAFDDLPAVAPAAVDVAGLLEQRRVAEQANRTREDLQRLVEQRSANKDTVARELVALRNQLNAKQGEFDTLTNQLESAILMRDAMEELPTDDIDAQIESADEVNAIVRRFEERKLAQNAADAKSVEADELTAAIKECDETKELALQQAKFPLPGLGFDENGVTYKGIPLADCATSEQLRVSVAIAMSMNPTLRIIRISDGSLLDADNKALIIEMAREHGFQVWIEEVDTSGSIGIVIEDGEVVAVNDDPFK